MRLTSTSSALSTLTTVTPASSGSRGTALRKSSPRGPDRAFGHLFRGRCHGGRCPGALRAGDELDTLVEELGGPRAGLRSKAQWVAHLRQGQKAGPGRTVWRARA